jgi:CheY-like chemotaxis protein
MVLRMRAVDLVEDAGFTAVQAVNADEALAILESRSDISLLFSDIQMPGSMDGLKLAHAVHDRWPSIKIILVSGQVKLADSDKPADSRFFGKPLEVKQMIAELQEMIGAGTLKVLPKAAIPLVVAKCFSTINITVSFIHWRCRSPR